MVKVSKNARAGSNFRDNFCSCGGRVFMRTLMEQGKVKNFASCEKCGKTARKPKMLK